MPDDGFYLLMLEKHEAVESATYQCYYQLFNKLDYFNGSVEVTVDGKKVPLKDDVFAETPDPKIVESNRADFFIFRQIFIKVFEDGTLLLKLIKDVAQVMDENLDELNAKFTSYAGKNHQNLRSVYWYIDKKFIVKMPPMHQVSFAVDCMMFGCWQLNSRNMLAMHLLALAWMLNVRALTVFMPPDLARHHCITNPPFKGFLEKKYITLVISIKDIKGSGAGAGVAKAVDKGGKRGAKAAKKGAKDNKKSAKDKKGAKK